MNAVSVIGTFSSLQCTILLLATAMWLDCRIEARRQRLLRRLSAVLDSQREPPAESGQLDVRPTDPAIGSSALPVWQNVLLTQGCEVQPAGDTFFLELQPVGDRIVCTPTMSGWMPPLQLSVSVGEPVTITWDHELSRILVTTAGHRLAA